SDIRAHLRSVLLLRSARRLYRRGRETARNETHAVGAAVVPYSEYDRRHFVFHSSKPVVACVSAVRNEVGCNVCLLPLLRRGTEQCVPLLQNCRRARLVALCEMRQRAKNGLVIAPV